MANLLFIDDDTDISTINAKYFTKLGHTVKTAPDTGSGIKLIKSFSPDCIILDVMMPNQNGFEACKLIKNICMAPIIFLSGCSSEEYKVNGLMLGADDYIVKPYSFKELSARIQVQLRRHMTTASHSSLLCYPPLSLDFILHKAYYNKEEIHLSNREYELLYLLMSHPNELVTFEEIGNSMWEYYSDIDRRTIMVTASRLRKKVSDYSGLENVIETVWSKGYKFIAK